MSLAGFFLLRHSLVDTSTALEGALQVPTLSYVYFDNNLSGTKMMFLINHSYY